MNGAGILRLANNTRLRLIDQRERRDHCGMMFGFPRWQECERRRQRAGDAACLAQIAFSERASYWTALRPKPARDLMLLRFVPFALALVRRRCFRVFYCRKALAVERQPLDRLDEVAAAEKHLEIDRTL